MSGRSLNRREVLVAAGAAYRQAGSRALLDLHRKGSWISAGYTGALTIGVNNS